MRKFLLILVSWICLSTARSQNYNLDSLHYLLSKSKADTNALNFMEYLVQGYGYFQPDFSYYFGRQEFLLAGRLGNEPSQA